jgi:hypothetical protein
MTPQPGFQCHLRRNFADAFRDWRRKQGIPLKQIAIELGFSVAAISKWERGKSFPSGQNFEMLVDYTAQPSCHLFCDCARRCRNHGCLLKRQARG